MMQLLGSSLTALSPPFPPPPFRTASRITKPKPASARAPTP